MTYQPAESGLALWRRVADAIESGIAGGKYQAGTRLPGELEIAEQFGVHRHTVRRALATLAERGLVRAERGSGTYVEAQRIAYPIRSRTRFSEIIGTSGREADGRLIDSSVEPAGADLAKKLGLKANAPVVRIDMLRQANRVPICVGTSWLPAERFPAADRIYKTTRSMTKTLAHFEVTDYRRAVTRVGAALVDAADCAALDLRPGSPILLVESVDHDLNGDPILTTRARFAAERIEFVIES